MVVLPLLTASNEIQNCLIVFRLKNRRKSVPVKSILDLLLNLSDSLWAGRIGHIRAPHNQASSGSGPIPPSGLDIARDFITALVDEVNAADSSARQVLASSGQLSSQIKQMDERLNQLQFGDRLYSPTGHEDSFLVRAKAFISKHLQGSA